ncbi:flagellar basal body rod protein FlgB [Roseospirillum parvum]|uniref:Flagellar basal body rod protein FlgB n=1 Tax=Roseospirillum parvum TaxID=83401 RepID=A0A1G8DII4_9PROT|nr:hypothetical protein [Roseospirillum parvum]SDH57180.1 flagellar basal-body rod protein FlgB [Roseospirillum parvum]
MNLSNLTLFKMAHDQMDWLAERQKLLSQNIANANTPDYVGRDLEPLTFKDMVVSRTQPTRPTLTHPSHLAANLPEPSRFDDFKERRPFEVSPDNNHVILEEQMAKMSTTKGRYELAAKLVSKHIKMVKAALGSPGA